MMPTRKPGGKGKAAVPPEVKQVFMAFDGNASGFLDFRELRNALEHYGIDTKLPDAERIVAAYDDQPDGKLNLDEFSELIYDLSNGVVRTSKPVSKVTAKAAAGRAKAAAGRAKAASGRIGARISSLRGASTHGARASSAVKGKAVVPPAVKQVFMAFDGNASGFLDFRELRNALEHYGIDTKLPDAERIVAAYDDQPDGKLNLDEFSELIYDLSNGVVRALPELAASRSNPAYACNYELVQATL